MATPNDEELNFDEDDSWYEDAMNALDSPVNNHHVIYSEDEISDLAEVDKQVIRLRNSILEKGYEYIDLQLGDYVCDIVFLCGTIDYKVCQFALTYKKDNHYLVIFKWQSAEEVNNNPLQLAGMVKKEKHYGTYRFLAFLHIEEEIPEDMEYMDDFKINRELTYKDKPSFEIFRTDDMKQNQAIVDYLGTVNPTSFEFYNDFVIFELPPNTDLINYMDVMTQVEKI